MRDILGRQIDRHFDRDGGGIVKEHERLDRAVAKRVLLHGWQHEGGHFRRDVVALQDRGVIQGKALGHFGGAVALGVVLPEKIVRTLARNRFEKVTHVRKTVVVRLREDHVGFGAVEFEVVDESVQQPAFQDHRFAGNERCGSGLFQGGASGGDGKNGSEVRYPLPDVARLDRQTVLAGDPCGGSSGSVEPVVTIQRRQDDGKREGPVFGGGR